MHHFDTIIPHVFRFMHSENVYLRYVCSNIVIKLAADDQLRLLDGQYFVFIGLLADEKDTIRKAMESFLRDTFVTTQKNILARYFVPSIIHYNRCYVSNHLLLLEKVWPCGYIKC